MGQTTALILLLHSFIFSFKRFDTEENYDFISVGHGFSRDNRSSTVIFKHSGSKLPDQRKFNSIGNAIWVTFTADDWDTRPGFTIRVQDTETFGKESIKSDVGNINVILHFADVSFYQHHK